VDEAASPGAPFGDELPHGRHEFHRNVHRGMGRRIVGGLILRDGLLIGLGLVVLKDATDALRVPTRRDTLLAS
jgi:hypothetical protein